MVLNDPCGPRYVTDTLGKGPGSLWEASGMPPQPPGEQAGGVRLGSFSAVYNVHVHTIYTILQYIHMKYT